MSDHGVSPSEMKRLGTIDDSDLDAMRAGRVPHGDASMEGITRFVQDIGEAYPEPSTGHLEEAHVAAMLQAAHLMADNGEPAVMSASKANGPASQVSGLPKPWRETIMLKLRTAFATSTVKLTAATVAMLLAFAGVAVAGVLPDPVQNSVADVASTVGIDLPGGTEEIEAAEVENIEVGDADEVDGLELEDADDAEGVDLEDADDADDAEDADDADDQDEDANESDDDEDEDRPASAGSHESDDDEDESASSGRDSDDDDDDGDSVSARDNDDDDEDKSDDVSSDDGSDDEDESDDDSGDDRESDDEGQDD